MFRIARLPGAISLSVPTNLMCFGEASTRPSSMMAGDNSFGGGIYDASEDAIPDQKGASNMLLEACHSGSHCLSAQMALIAADIQWARIKWILASHNHANLHSGVR